MNSWHYDLTMIWDKGLNSECEYNILLWLRETMCEKTKIEDNYILLACMDKSCSWELEQKENFNAVFAVL